MLAPSEEFESPEAVVKHPHLSVAQKTEILERWEYDVRELAVAEEENMRGGETAHLLQQIHQALDQVNPHPPQTDTGSHTKHR